jgi:hypothetical protein
MQQQESEIIKGLPRKSHSKGMREKNVHLAYGVTATLTTAEKKELKELQPQREQFADRIAGPPNDMLELLLLGLEHKAAQQKSLL